MTTQLNAPETPADTTRTRRAFLKSAASAALALSIPAAILAAATDPTTKARRLARAWRRRLGVTGMAQPADAWRLKTALPEVGLLTADLTNDYVLHLPTGETLLTVRQGLTEEQQMDAFLTVVGQHFCARHLLPPGPPARGQVRPYVAALEASQTERDRIGAAFRDGFIYG